MKSRPPIRRLDAPRKLPTLAAFAGFLSQRGEG